MKTNYNKFDQKMRKLSEATELDFDGGDNRLFANDEMRITVYCNLLDKKQYAKMEREIRKAVIKRATYTVYCWNDCSGFEYWKRQGETGDSNYIQITVSVKSPARVKAEQLIRDVNSIYNKVCHWDNLDEYWTQKNEEVENE